MDNNILRFLLNHREELVRNFKEDIQGRVGHLLGSTKFVLWVTGKKLTMMPDTFIIAQDTLGEAIHELRNLTRSFNTEELSKFDIRERLLLRLTDWNVTGKVDLDIQLPSHHPINTYRQMIIFLLIENIVTTILRQENFVHLSLVMRTGTKTTSITFTLGAFSEAGITPELIKNSQQVLNLLEAKIPRSSLRNRKNLTFSVPNY